MIVATTTASLRDSAHRGAAEGILVRPQHAMALAFFAAVVALSILAPGRRATRINPVQALQHE